MLLESRAVQALRRPANWIQLMHFCAVGASGYVVNLAVYTLLLKGFGVHYLGMRFFVVSGLVYCANLVALSLLVSLGVGKVAAQAVAIILVTPLNFLGNKLWSFRS